MNTHILSILQVRIWRMKTANIVLKHVIGVFEHLKKYSYEEPDREIMENSTEESSDN